MYLPTAFLGSALLAQVAYTSRVGSSHMSGSLSFVPDPYINSSWCNVQLHHFDDNCSVISPWAVGVIEDGKCVKNRMSS
jgi:hypothetical protein